MLIAASLTSLLYRLSSVISRNRDVNLPVIKVIAMNLATDQSKAAISDDNDWGLFKLATHSLKTSQDAGRQFQNRLFLGCILINLAIGAVTFHDVYAQSDARWLPLVHPNLERNGTLSVPNSASMPMLPATLENGPVPLNPTANGDNRSR